MDRSKRPRKSDASEVAIAEGTSVPPKRVKKAPGPRSSFRLARSNVPSTSAASSTTTTLGISQRKATTTRTISDDRLEPDARESGVSISNDSPNDPPPAAHANDPVQSENKSEKKARRKRFYSNKNKLKEWLPLRQIFLDELLRHDGFGDYLAWERKYGAGNCSKCFEKPSDSLLYKCTLSGCWDGRLLSCLECLKETHSNHPLHHIEIWNGLSYTKTSLAKLKVRYQLGHGGGPCTTPKATPKNFLVFNITGAHHVNLDYCGCNEGLGIEKHVQLIRAGWFPSTFSQPQTVFTFEALDTFHELTLQSKITLFDYYQTLIRKTDKLYLEPVPSRNNDFQHCFRLWKCLFLLKRAGRGHDPAGIEATKPGELAMECPACPIPCKNLPVDWEKSSILFIYALFLAVDANFKLKGKARGLADVELMPGWAYCVEESAYQAHLKRYQDEPKINTCHSEHDAIVRAAVRCTPGYNVTGAGLVMCSRHGLICANGVCDLQKGERYCNMDFVILAALVFVFQLSMIIITYDITCQWSKNLDRRMVQYPDTMKIPSSTKMISAIPSWHINGHGARCQTDFSLGYIPGMGRTCGNEIEGTFSHTNSLGASFREMAPGGRHDALNDTYSGYNMVGVVRFQQLFTRKLKNAYAMKEIHNESYKRLCESFSEDTLSSWATMITIWEGDHTKPNPYQEVESCTSMQDVCLELANEEASLKGVVNESQMSMTALITVGIDLEEQQRNLTQERGALKDSTQTSKQAANLLEKSLTLFQRIQNWRKSQLIWQPYVLALLPIITAEGSGSLGGDTRNPETIDLHLPSSTALALHESIPKLSETEERLREAQANDCLSEIHRLRRVITGLWQFKKLNLSGEGNKPNTRLRTAHSRLQAKIHRAADRYRAARQALTKLKPNGDWTQTLLVLEDAHISGPAKEADEKNGTYVMSWIWSVAQTVSVDADEAGLSEVLRVEWAKARARRLRWGEEYQLVQEEMRWTIAYMEWKSGWWLSRSETRQTNEDSYNHGIVAYAHKQSAICEQLVLKFKTRWSPLVHKMGLTPEWADGVDSEVDGSDDEGVEENEEDGRADCEGNDGDGDGDGGDGDGDESDGGDDAVPYGGPEPEGDSDDEDTSNDLEIDPRVAEALDRDFD